MTSIALEYHAGESQIRLINKDYGVSRDVPFEFLIDNKRLSGMHPGAELISERADLIRVRSRGRAAMRFLFEGMKQFENACPREDGGIEVAFIQTGKLLFVPLRGALWHNAMWIPAKAQTQDFVIDLLPSVETNEFEACILAYFSNGRLEK